MESEFPSNSHANKQNVKKPGKSVPEKKVEKVVTGKVVTRKKPLGRRFMDHFAGDDSKSVASYVFFDIVVPSIKDTIADAVSQGIERKLFGEARSTSRRGRGYSAISGPGHSAYSRMYSAPPGVGRPDPRAASPSRRARAQHNFDEIILETRVEATAVLDQMYELLSNYDLVTVADLYELVDVQAAFTDEKYGWTDLRGADVTRVREGYLLDLPRPEPLD